MSPISHQPNALFVIVDGPPASGKSTVAAPLAITLGLPLVAKDTVKDALMKVLPPSDVEASRNLGRAAVAAMLAVAGQCSMGAVIESNFYRSMALDELRRLPGRLVEVFCRCDRATALGRYRRRAGSRAAGHFDSARTEDEIWNEEISEPVAGGWPVIEVVTTQPLNIEILVGQIREAAGWPDP